MDGAWVILGLALGYGVLGPLTYIAVDIALSRLFPPKGFSLPPIDSYKRREDAICDIRYVPWPHDALLGDDGKLHRPWVV